MPKIVDHDQRRLKIVQAVWRLISDSGFERATMREIAAEAGFTHGAMKPYFASKDELFTLAFTFVFTETNARMSAATAELTGIAALRAYCLEILPVNELKLSEARIVIPFWHLALNDPVKAGVHESALRKWRTDMTRFVQSGRAAGEIGARLDDACIVGHLMTLTQGAQVTATLTPDAQPPHSMVEQLDAYLALLAPA